MSDNDKPVANPLVILREEFDDWAILFDPDSGEGYGLNPVSVFVWKHLDGKHTVQEITNELRENCEDVPDDAEASVKSFVEELLEKGLAGYEFQKR